MGAKGDFILVILIVVGLGIAWLFTGGPERARHEGAFLDQPKPLGSGESYGRFNFSILPSLNIISGDKPSNIEQEANKVQDGLDDISDEFGDIQAHGEFSKYENKIVIEKRTTGPKNDSIDKEYVIISASRRNNENISITGWQLESMITKKKVTIGGATPLFISGVINAEPPISLARGEEVIISTGRSPIGASFKINKCTGYFEQFQDFKPSLKKSCPRPSDEFDRFANIPVTDDVCEDFVDDISRCEMPLDAYPIGTSNQCSEFVSATINYTGCVKNHRGDLDFIGDEWRVFLERNTELWREKREVIRLLDNEGKIVDIFNY